MKPALLALLAFSILHFSFSISASAQRPRPLNPISENLEPTRSVLYKKAADRDLFLHVFEPHGHKPTDQRPAWVSIHGGGWTGQTARVKYPFAHHFARLGMVGFSIDYRLLPRPKGTTVFDCVADGRSAIRYIRAHASDFGIDPDRIVVTGHSAGAHVASGTVLFEGVDDPADDLSVSSVPNALVLYYPVIDTSEKGYGQKKIGDRWRELSPVHNVRPGLPPMLVLHGTGDTVTPYEGAKLFHEKMLAAGNTCELLTNDGGVHGYLIFDLALYREAIEQTESFLGATGILPHPEEAIANRKADPLRLNIPHELFAAVGTDTSIDFDNAVLTETPGAYRFNVICDIGATDKNRWSASPTAVDAGDHDLTLTVSGPDGKIIDWASATLHVVPADAGKTKDIRLLIVGDSLTNASHYPNEIARLLALPGNPKWTMLGTHRPKNAAPGTAHEGYGGWSWIRFVSRYEAEPRTDGRKGTSPFVYLDANGKPVLDVARYITEECGGDPPDFVTFLLGINDCFSADPENPDPKIDAMMAPARTLIAAFQEAAPDAELGLCLTTPGNSRQEAFEANYKDKYSRWNWKKIQHRLVERQLEEFADREDENLFLVPTELNLDPTNGYPANNGVHPNEAGYNQIGASIYSWLKWRMAQ